MSRWFDDLIDDGAAEWHMRARVATGIGHRPKALKPASEAPPPPAPPPCRVIHYGPPGFAGPADEFEKWKAEPLWRRALGVTAWDRNRK